MSNKRGSLAVARRPVARGFVLACREEILAELRRAAPDHPLAHEMPALLDALLREASDEQTAAQPGELPPHELVDALTLVRDCILSAWQRNPSSEGAAELREISRAIDRKIVAALATPAASHERAAAKLASLLAAPLVGIGFVDRELRYLHINDALAALNGIPAADHIGRTIGDVLGDDAPPLEALVRRVLQSGDSAINVELSRAMPGTGEEKYLLANYFPVRVVSGEVTAVGVIVIDITEAKLAQQALTIERMRLQSIIEHSPAAIWVKDPDGRIVLTNHRLAAAIGLTYEDVIDRRSDDLLPPEVAAEHQEHDRRVREDNVSIEVEEHVPSPDGLRTFLAIKFPIPGDPPLVGGIATEITDRKRMEEELRIALRVREELLAIVSHDLRNPLNTIKLSATMLENQLGTAPQQRRYVDMIARSCMRMENLINDLLDSAKIRAGRLQLDIKPHSAEKIVAEATELQQALADEKGIELGVDCCIEGVVLMCDHNRMLQVFTNLIGNAIKFCRAGDSIRISATRDDKFVRFAITDTGPGVPPEVLPHLFDAYRSGREHTGQGAGLGLYIVRGIVERHGGTVGVESEPGKGATFFFTIPVA